MEDVKSSRVCGETTVALPCLCGALRQASRAVTRVYDAELRGTGLRSTQYSLLRVLERVGEVRQGDLGERTALEETTLTRNLRPLLKAGWVTARAGADRREKLVAITEAGRGKLQEAGPGWLRAQERLKGALSEGTWELLIGALPGVVEVASSRAK